MFSDNVGIAADIAGVAGLFISLGHIIFRAVMSLKKPVLTIEKCNYNETGAYFSVFIENVSYRPLAIYDVVLTADKKDTVCVREPLVVEEHTHHLKRSDEFTEYKHSTALPFTIESRQSCHATLYFQGDTRLSENLIKPPVLKFTTKNGTVKKALSKELLKKTPFK